PFLPVASDVRIPDAAGILERPDSKSAGGGVLTDHLHAADGLAFLRDRELAADEILVRSPVVLGGNDRAATLGFPSTNEPIEIAKGESVARPLPCNCDEPLAVLPREEETAPAHA